MTSKLMPTNDDFQDNEEERLRKEQELRERSVIKF